MDKRLSISYCLLITCFLLLTFCAILINQLLTNEITLIPISIQAKLHDNETYYLSMHRSSLFFYFEKDFKNTTQLFLILKQNGSFLIMTENDYFMKPDFQHLGLSLGNNEFGERFILKEQTFGFFHILTLDSYDELVVANYSYKSHIYQVLAPKSSNFANSTNVDLILIPRFFQVYA